MAIEEVYFGKNVRSAMAVGQASGIAMLAAAERGVRCFAYTPQAIKMAVCGSGGAGKKQVQRMVGTLLGLPEPPNPDHAADALAVAICHGGGAGRRAGGRGGDRAAGAGGGVIAAVRGEVLVRRPDHVVIDANGVGYRLTVSAETLKAVPAAGARGLPARRARRPRRLPGALRLRLRGGARPLRRAGLGQRRRPQGRDRGPLRRARRASCCGRSPPATRNASRPSRGSASGPRSGSSSSCATRSPARSRRRSSRRSPRAATPATSPATASSTSATRRSRPSSCSTASRATTRRS